MKHAPYLWKAWDLYSRAEDGPRAQTAVGFYVPPRRLGLFSLRNRIKLAWGVFMGRYDALAWLGPCR